MVFQLTAIVQLTRFFLRSKVLRVERSQAAKSTSRGFESYLVSQT
jgi:hypothetical protein